MDPKPINSLDWNNIAILIGSLWILLISVVVFGGAFLLAHVFLPSLMPTGVQSKQKKGLRLLLYTISGFALATVVFVATQTLVRLNAILYFYPRFWI